MADNVGFTPGAGAIFAADDIGGVLHQRLKMEYGADGSATDVSPGAPLPTAPGAPVAMDLATAPVSVSGSGDNALVAAVAGQTTRIHACNLVFAGAVSAKFTCGATDKTGAMPMLANGSICLERRGRPHFVTAANEAFNLNLSAAVAVTGWIEYETSA